ncbi:MAG: cyclase family protein [Limisphaerales bacterium]
MNLRPLSLTCVCVVFLAGCVTSQKSDAPSDQGRWVDLTHEFSFDTIYWPTANGFEHTLDFKGMTPKGYFYASYEYKASEHGGTHLDAPIHFANDRMTTEKIPLEKLIAPGVVVHLPNTVKGNADYQVAVADLRAWEETHGRIPNRSILLLNTGWHRHWPNRKSYLGTDERGPEAVPKLHFPGLSPEAAQWLVDDRNIAAVGIDTASIDYGQSTLFASHRILFKKNIPAFENVTNLDSLPATGSFVVALPMKIKGGSGGPLRIVAQVPTNH